MTEHVRLGTLVTSVTYRNSAGKGHPRSKAACDTYPKRSAARVNARAVADRIGRFRLLADAGVQTAIVSLPDLAETGPVERFAEVIKAFATG